MSLLVWPLRWVAGFQPEHPQSTARLQRLRRGRAGLFCGAVGSGLWPDDCTAGKFSVRPEPVHGLSGPLSAPT